MESSLASVLNDLFSILGVHRIELSAPFRGFSHDVYILDSTAGQKWSLRVAKDEFAASMAQRSFDIMRHMAKVQPKLAIPIIIHAGKTYSILEYIEGIPVGSWMCRDSSATKRHKMLDGLATFLYRLWTCATSPIETDTRTMTYRDWLLCEIDKAIRRAIQNPGWGNLSYFLQRRAKVDELIPLEGDDRGMLIAHGDMSALNVLVDDGVLSGVIDWDTAMVVPAPAAIQHPLFMANIPGYHNGGKLECMDFADDRAYLECTIRNFSTDGGRLADLLATSGERQFLQLSLRNKHINAEYVRLRCNEDVNNGAIIGEQLAEFLSKNVDLVDNSVLVELQRQILIPQGKSDESCV